MLHTSMSMQSVVVFTTLFMSAYALRDDRLHASETEVKSNVSFETEAFQAGSLFDGQYVLLSKLAMTEWPQEGLPGFTGIMALGEGTFGETWLATTKDNQQVAVKFFYRDTNRGRILLNMMNADADEATVLASASTECAAPGAIMAGGTSGQNRFARCITNKAQAYQGPSYIVMEVAGNQNLEKYLERRPPPSVDNILRISKMLVEALAQLQQSKYVHRDIKPANIMLTVAGRDVLDLKVIDFGLTLKNTQSVFPSGTPLYMPPELWPVILPQRAAPAHSHDVYSVGETIFEMLCGTTFHDKILDEFYDKENVQKKTLLEQELKQPRCTPPRAQTYFDDDRFYTLFELAAKDMMSTTGRTTGTIALSNSMWEQVSPAQEPEKKQVDAIIAAPEEVSFLRRCHASKSFWFEHLVKCCMEEKPDDLRNAVCEKPCGGNVGYKPGARCMDQTHSIACGSDQKQFSSKLFCCVSTQFPNTCDYVGLWNNEKKKRFPTLPKGKGWGWMLSPTGGVKLPKQ